MLYFICALLVTSGLIWQTVFFAAKKQNKYAICSGGLVGLSFAGLALAGGLL